MAHNRTEAWIRIGSARECDLQVDRAGVDPQHAQASMAEDGSALVVDMQSRGGIALNRPGERRTVVSVSEKDTLYLGNEPVAGTLIIRALRVRRDAAPSLKPELPPQTPPPSSARRNPPLTPAPHPQSTISLDVKSAINYIGRDPNCQIVLDHPTVAPRHAVLTHQGKQYFIQDLGTMYGTYLDGVRVGRTKRLVPHNSEIGIAGFRLRLAGDDAGLAVKSFQKGVDIRAHDLENWVGWPRKRINLAGVSLFIPAGKLVAMMGPSGAGKSTLLRILGGQRPPVRGQVFYNDISVYANHSEIQPLLGYVPQEDIFHNLLETREVLRYAAHLRLPPEKDPSLRAQKIDALMDRLGIRQQATTRVSDLSGGQRKRVNLATELLVDPTVLVLDEPTSGLSSVETMRIIGLLRDLAHQEGKTIVVTIHSPPTYVFEMFDLLAVVDSHGAAVNGTPSPGQLIFMGDAREAGAHFHRFDPTGRSRDFEGADAVLEALDKNAAKTAPEWEREFRESPNFTRYVEQPLKQELPAAAEGYAVRPLASVWQHFDVQIQRLAALKLADRKAAIFMLMQPVVVGALIGLITAELRIPHQFQNYAEQTRVLGKLSKALFQLVVSAVWFGCNNSIREIVGEWPVYARERLAGLRLRAYISSKVVIYAVISAVQTLLALGIVNLITSAGQGEGLEGNPLLLWLLLWLTAMVGVTIGLLISATVKSNDQAIQWVPLVLLPMIIFSGGMTRLAEMPSGVRTIASVMPARWAYEGALIVENQDRPITLVPGPQVQFTPGAPPVDPKFAIVDQFFSRETHAYPRDLIRCLIILSGVAGFAALATGICLRLRDVG